MMSRQSENTPRACLQRLEKALDAGYRYRPSEMLSWFVSSLLSLWGLKEWLLVPADVQGQIIDAIEAYTEVVGAHEPFEDVLGPVYMALGRNSHMSGLGQFFTPWSIALAMARISVGDAAIPADERLLTACDPCSGSGVMMLALCNHVLQTKGAVALRRFGITCCDLDPLCARLSAVQLIANCNVHNLEIGEVLVYRGNSLMPWEHLEVVVHAHPKAITAPLVPARSPARLAALTAAGTVHPDAQSTQMSLFDLEREAA